MSGKLWKTLNQCWLNNGPPSQTLDQHYGSIAWMSVALVLSRLMTSGGRGISWLGLISHSTFHLRLPTFSERHPLNTEHFIRGTNVNMPTINIPHAYFEFCTDYTIIGLQSSHLIFSLSNNREVNWSCMIVKCFSVVIFRDWGLWLAIWGLTPDLLMVGLQLSRNLSI